MAKLANRIQNALDEGRILVLGMQILLGFQYRAFFEPGFERLPGWAQATKLTSVCVMLAALALVLLPGPFHRLTEGGEDTERLHRVASVTTSLALGPFAVSLGLDVLVAMARVAGVAARFAFAMGAATGGVALACWYALPVIRRRSLAQEDDVESSGLDKKIRHVLTEARMVLPGVLAMLGFQLGVTLMDGFDGLPREWQLVHACATLVTALAVVLLVAPAAYHRIAEEGEETERFHRVASRFVVAALVPLALSIGAELAVVTWRLTRSVGVAVALGAGAGLALVAAWIAFPLAVRAADRARRREPARA